MRLKTNVFKQPENPLQDIERLFRSLFGKKTLQDELRDHMYNDKNKKK